MTSSTKAVDTAKIQELYERAQRAFEEVEFWPQERVDEKVETAEWGRD